MLADVALARPLPNALTYLIPEGWRVVPGSRVMAPLGRTVCEGIVVGVRDEPAPEGFRVKALAAVMGEGPALTGELLELGRWMAGYYIAAPGEALGAMVHPFTPPRREIWYRLDIAKVTGIKAGTREAKAIAWIDSLGGVGSARQAKEELGAAASVMSKLVTRGVMVREDRAPPPPEPGPLRMGEFPELTAAQVATRDEIGAAIDRREASVHLLHGVTGSGKTEIYLQLIKRVLEAGGGAIFLVPEISLTVPMISLFRERFGATLALFHSGLTPSERHREWSAVRNGAARVVVGARSAVFAPIDGLRLVILDEEAETSYKQSERPCYHARDVAVERGRIAGFPVVLGSATPSLESMQAAKDGRFRYHRLAERFNRQPLPSVELVDMAREFSEKRNRSIFSWKLKSALEATLAANRQSLLFLNRRGHSTYVFCRACGFVLECHQCSVALTFHQRDESCRCHQCDHVERSPEKCPGCGSSAIRFMGLGTEKVEEEFRMNFPGVACARMDSDTTSSRGSHQKLYEDFAEGRTRVLVGTQMVAKGFNFSELDLVGVVNADVALRLPDFRAAERTFQLVTQVAGRVGRADRPGHVLVQTYTPGHHSLVHASSHDFDGFAAEELPQRQALFYPPFSALILVGADSESESGARDALASLGEELSRALAGIGRHQVLGPAKAPLARVKGRHRYQLLLKLEREGPVPAAARVALAGWQPPSAVSFRIDVDPVRMV